MRAKRKRAAGWEQLQDAIEDDKTELDHSEKKESLER